MRNWLISALILSLGVLLPMADAGKKNKDDDDEKDGLAALQEFIGGWKGTADDKTKPASGPRNRAGAGASRARTAG